MNELGKCHLGRFVRTTLGTRCICAPDSTHMLKGLYSGCAIWNFRADYAGLTRPIGRE